MRRIRASWLIVIAVVLTILAVRPLRQQAIPVPLAIPPRSQDNSQTDAFSWTPTSRWLAVCRPRAIPFAQKRYPKDPAMLLAAALVADSEESLPLIKRVAETMNYPPAWAACFSRIEKPSYARMGNSGANPLVPESIADAEAYMRESGEPERLDPKTVAPILDLLHSWQAADPENALPVALEAYYLYGLHRDAEALGRWEAASELPTVSAYFSERVRDATNLLLRLGMPESDAVMAALSAPMLDLRANAMLRQCARVAQYEGYMARLQGRPSDAICWWRSTSDLGHHAQESADNAIGFLVGVAIEGIGTSPTWRWYLDSFTRIPGGPIAKGRFLSGDSHDFYVQQVGAAADATLRDRVVQAKVRTQVMHEYWKEHSFDNSLMRSLAILSLAAFAGGSLGILLVIYLVIGSWRRRQADAASALGLIWQFVLALLILLPAGLAAMSAWLPSFPGFPRLGILIIAKAVPPFAEGWVACLSLLFAIFLPLLAAALRRQPGARTRTAWRGNARKILPNAAAICALVGLALLIVGARYRAQWVREWTQPGSSEMATVIKALGPSWADPTIPPDSWRAEYPPTGTPASAPTASPR